MWSYNYDYLCHGKFKYVDKYLSKAKNWVYVYADKAKKGFKQAQAKTMDAANKLYNKANETYNKTFAKNLYTTNKWNYDSKVKKVEQTKEWQNIVKSKNSEYVKKNKDGTYSYNIDDYLMKKKHPVLDVIDDMINGRPLSTNEITLDSLVAGADDYVQFGMAYVGLRAKILSEGIKYSQGSYKDEEQDIYNTIEQGSKLVKDLAKTYENNPQAAADLMNQYSAMAERSQNIQKIANMVETQAATKGLTVDNVIDNEGVQDLMQQYNITESDIKKYL